MAQPVLSSGPIAAIEAQLEQLSPRDRKLLMGLVTFLALVFVGGLWFVLQSQLEQKAAEVRDAKAQLQQVQVLQQEYLDATRRREAQESRLRSFQNKPLSAYIEELAGRHGLLDSLRAVNAQGAPEVVGNLKQASYTVDLQKADIEPLLQFLVELEKSSFPASVEEAQFRITYVRREKKYNLKLDLVVFSLAEA